MDDINEFLKRPYSLGESKNRMPNLTRFYAENCIAMPNYLAVDQHAKYIFKNLNKKYRLLNKSSQ